MVWTLSVLSGPHRLGVGAGVGEAADQLMRLNNWSAMTGEMHSWDAYRYMTQGY